MQHYYEVMRFIRQNGDCHIVMDNVKGENLGEFVLQNPKMEKKQFFQCVGQILKEMESIEMARGISAYAFLIPFNVVLKENKEIALLNLKTKSNQRRLEKILTNKAIEQFFPEDGSYNDIYSFGRTLQYLLAKIELYPCLTKKEEKQFQKIISKCTKINSKRSYQSFEEILADIPETERKTIKKRTVILGICALLLSLTAIFKICFGKEDISEEKMDAYMQTGITYFNTVEDFEKSEEIFAKISDSYVADCYQRMAEFMQGDGNTTEAEMEEILEKFQEKMGEQLEYEQKYSLLKVYDKINSETADRQVVKLAEQILNSPDWYKNEEEVRSILEKRKIE